MPRQQKAKRLYSQPIELEDPWKTALLKAGLTSPRTGDPSLQALSRETGVHPSALSRIISGKTRNPKPPTIAAIAKALDTNIVEVAQWIGLSWNDYEPWTPPEESSLMSQAQRDLVEDLIRQLTRGHGS